MKPFHRLLALAVLAVLFAWGVPSAAAQSAHCDRCGRVIPNGQVFYRTADRHHQNICGDCKRYLTPTECKTCRTPMPDGGASFRGEFGYCTNCAALLEDAFADRCLVCQTPVRQQVVADGAVLCSPACAAKYRMDKTGARTYAALTCAHCGKALAANNGHACHRYAGQLTCSDDCTEALFPKCYTCGRPTPSQRRVAGKIVCSDKCAAPLSAPCIVCRKPCDSPSTAPVCADCARTAVRTQAEADALLATTQGEIAWLFNQPIGCTPRLLLVTHDEICAAAGALADGTGIIRGLYSCQRSGDPAGGGRPAGGCTIRVLGDLPKEVLRDVIAHEATHHWLAHHAPGALGDREEGFCEYISTVITHFHGNLAIVNAKMDNMIGVYRDGLMWWYRHAGQFPRKPIPKGIAAPWLEIPPDAE